MQQGPEALIGYTGFVGGNLLLQHAFQDLYNSSNIEQIQGHQYSLLVCSGARAEKWKINQDPETDWAGIERLMAALRCVQCDKLVLISTVDVYPAPVDVDEDTLIEAGTLSPYGKHRLRLEEFCVERFSTLIVRLPGLFGTGLKKNVIFDFLNENNLEKIHADGSFQFYCLDHLWRDIEVALEASLSLVNFATEPLTVKEIAQEVFETNFENRPEGTQGAIYEFKSKHAERFGGHNGFLYNKAQVLNDLRAFVGQRRVNR